MIDIHQFSGRMGNEMFRHAYLYAQARKGNIPDTYLQDPKYFEGYEDEIKKLFGEGIGYLPYVGIHLRRGDYVNHPFHANLAATGYYIDATNLFPNRKFLVFSDDIPFAKTYFEGDRFAFDDSESDLESFNKFASCDSHIIANSTWSWWGAYLSPTLAKKVVAPTFDKWYTDGNSTRTVIPPEWIQI